MKKWLLALLILILIAISLLYFLIPGAVFIKQERNIATHVAGFKRTIADENKWAAWWPEKPIHKSTSFPFNGAIYSIVEKRLTSVLLSISDGGSSYTSEFFFIPVGDDSLHLSWQVQMPSSNNPFTRLKNYFEAKNIQKDITALLNSLQQYYIKEENLYATPVIKELVKDSTLISTFTTSNAYPTVDAIYDLVEKLEGFAVRRNATVTGIPMLNVTTDDSVNYLTRVALPVDKKLKDSANIAYKWMLGGGNILVTEVTGGNAEINKAFKEMEHYITDHKRVAPAIPFQSLVTDRRKQPDSTKWVTKLYWPVM